MMKKSRLNFYSLLIFNVAHHIILFPLWVALYLVRPQLFKPHIALTKGQLYCVECTIVHTCELHMQQIKEHKKRVITG